MRITIADSKVYDVINVLKRLRQETQVKERYDVLDLLIQEIGAENDETEKTDHLLNVGTYNELHAFYVTMRLGTNRLRIFAKLRELEQKR